MMCVSAFYSAFLLGNKTFLACRTDARIAIEQVYLCANDARLIGDDPAGGPTPTRRVRLIPIDVWMVFRV